MLFVASRIMYGDPDRWLQDGFHLLAGTTALYVAVRRSRAADVERTRVSSMAV
jgi:hypothetical protein